MVYAICLPCMPMVFFTRNLASDQGGTPPVLSAVYSLINLFVGNIRKFHAKSSDIAGTFDGNPPKILV